MYDNAWCNLLPPPCLPGWMLEAARWTLLPESVWFQYGHGWMLNTLAETSMCTVWYPFQHLQHKMVVINIHDYPNIIHQHHTSTIILWNIIHFALVVDTSLHLPFFILVIIRLILQLIIDTICYCITIGMTIDNNQQLCWYWQTPRINYVTMCYQHLSGWY